MLEYALKTMNMIEYTDIYLINYSAEYVRILNVADEVRSISLLYKLLSSYRDRRWSVL